MSKERIYAVGVRVEENFLLSAIAATAIPSDNQFHEKFGTDGFVEVELLINGHSVPFKAVINDWWERCDRELELRAKRAAVKMVTAAGLDPIADALRDAEQTIREALKVWEES